VVFTDLNAPAVTTLASMFEGCTSLCNVDLSTFTPGDGLTSAANMFKGCTNIPEPKYNMSHMTFDEVANAI
jgi:hypothetical protein